MAGGSESSRSLRWARAIRGSGLPVAERAVAWALVTYMDDTGACHPKQETLAEATGMHVKTLREKVAVLRKSGWLRVELDRRGEGRGCRTTYVALFPDPAKTGSSIADGGSGQQSKRSGKKASSTANPGSAHAPSNGSGPASTTAESGTGRGAAEEGGADSSSTERDGGHATTTAISGTRTTGTRTTGTSPHDDHYRESFPTTTADRGSQELPGTPKNSQNTYAPITEFSAADVSPPAGVPTDTRSAPSSPATTPWPKYGFDAFWDAYPADKRVSKPKTRQRWMAALNAGATDTGILRALDAWKLTWATYDDRRYVPETLGWFDKERWRNPPAAPTASERPRGRQSLAERNDQGGSDFVARLVAAGHVAPNPSSAAATPAELATVTALPRAAGGNP